MATRTSLRAINVGLLANRELRRGPDSLMVRFVREFEPYLMEFQPRIYTVEGTYRAILRAGLLHDYDHARFITVGPGYQGGIAKLTEMVVKKRPGETATQEGEGTPGDIDKVIYFIDPRDPTSLFPESHALKRECVVAGKMFLSTYAGARDWMSLSWYTSTDDSGKSPHASVGQYFISKTLLEHHLFADKFGLQAQTIALIAHDAKKMDMLTFAREHFKLLEHFADRLATGTTGALLMARSHLVCVLLGSC